MIKVDEEKCIGCGMCASICEEVFEIKNSKAKVRTQKSIPCVQKAIENCPVNAITK